MKKQIRKGAAVLLSVGMAASLAACGGAEGTGGASGSGAAGSGQTAGAAEAGAAEAGTAESGASQEETAITFSWWGGDSRHEATEKAVEAFMEKYPHITVEPEYGAWTGWEEKQSMNLVGGNGADLMQINWNWIDNYGQNGTMFLDLYQYGDIIDLSQFPQETLDQCSVDGKLMAIPVSNTGCLFYWNKNTFETVGCPIPTDLDSLLAAGAAFEAYGEDYYPLVIDSGFSRMIFMVYYLESVYGKPWVENGQLQYTEEEIQTGLGFMKQLEEAHVIPTLAKTDGDMADSTDKNPNWIDGKYAGIYVWDASAGKHEDAIRESVNVPGQELVRGEFLRFGDYDGGYTKISMAFAIPSTSEHPKEAAMLIEYLLNDPEGVEICALERGVPLSAKGVALIEEKGIGDPDLIEANKAVIAYSKFPLDPKFDSNDLKADPDGAYEKVFGKLSYGEYDVQAAAKELYESVNEVLGN